MTSLDPIDVALRVTRVFDRLGIVHTIGGSIAASVAGEPRSSIDIDIVAALDEERISAVAAALREDFYVDEDALRRAVRDKTSTNLVHYASQVKIDIFVAGGTPLDALQLERRLRVDLGDTRVLHVHPPEDILLQKLRWHRIGREAFDRQWRDILGIIRTQGPRLDRDYVARNAPALDVEDLLSRALADTEES